MLSLAVVLNSTTSTPESEASIINCQDGAGKTRTGSDHLYVQTIFLEDKKETCTLFRSQHHNHPQDDPKAQSSSEPVDPRRVLQRQLRKRGKRGRFNAMLKTRASSPPLPSLLLANVWSLENKLEELRARITAHLSSSSSKVGPCGGCCYCLSSPSSKVGSRQEPRHLLSCSDSCS